MSIFSWYLIFNIFCFILTICAVKIRYKERLTWINFTLIMFFSFTPGIQFVLMAVLLVYLLCEISILITNYLERVK